MSTEAGDKFQEYLGWTMDEIEKKEIQQKSRIYN
jgi:hypothetical protein